MKFLIALIICTLALFSCENKSTYSSFGKKIIADDAIASRSMEAHYKVMQKGDSINSKIRGIVTDVCKAKGCWMTLSLPEGEDVMVKFKDYGFFVPKDIEGKEVIINGKAYIKEVSVKDQKHYAKDAGKSEAEIASITAPKRTFAFEADGVLITK